MKLPSWLRSDIPAGLLSVLPGWNARLAEGVSIPDAQVIHLPGDPGMRFETTPLTRILFLVVGLLVRLLRYMGCLALAARLQESGWTWRRAALILKPNQGMMGFVTYRFSTPGKLWKVRVRGGPFTMRNGFSPCLSKQPTQFAFLWASDGTPVTLFLQDESVPLDDVSREEYVPM